MEISKDELNIALSRYKEEVFTVRDYLSALEKIGIKKGDTICVHSQLFSFGAPVCNRETFLHYICKVLLDKIGVSGTLIMPTFTYSFCKKQIYDVQNTPSTVGILTEYFRKVPGVKRTKHPIFSFSVVGARQEEFTDICCDAFDLHESVYGKMLQMNDKVILFGAPKGYTFYYLAEQFVGVSHRYFKKFDGILIDEGRQYNETVPYYVRYLDRQSSEDEFKVDSYLLEKNLLDVVNISGGSIRKFNCKEAFEAFVDKLRDDETYFLASKC